MSCIETSFCGAFHLDPSTGFDTHMTSRIDMSQSGIPDKGKDLYASGYLAETGLENKITHSIYSGPMNLEPALNFLSSDMTVQNGASATGSISNQDSSINPDLRNWKVESGECRALVLTRFPSKDSLQTESSVSVCSNQSVHISPSSHAEIEIKPMLHSINSPILHSSPEMENQIYTDFQPSEDYYHADQNALENIPIPLSTSYNLFCGSSNDAIVAAPLGINISAESLNFNHALIEHSMWEDNFMGSPEASHSNDEWSHSHVINSPISFSSSVGSSPSFFEDLSNQAENSSQTTTIKNRKKINRSISSKVGNEMVVASGKSPVTEHKSFDTPIQLIGRSSNELENNAREHPLYHNVSPQADGLYHCPWENDSSTSCQHRPEKLKCNYDKFVDSHLKPYRCKVLACKDLHFSSTACLLRHEREAHAMHGHGDKPFLCKYEGCERGVPGNGFPRHWNLRDHMKRVHNDSGLPKTNISGTSSAVSAPAKGRKRKACDVNQSLSKRLIYPNISQQTDSSLIERYREKHQVLTEIVKQLQDPKHMDNLILLRNANDCINSMVQTTQKINALPNSAMQAG